MTKRPPTQRSGSDARAARPAKRAKPEAAEAAKRPATSSDSESDSDGADARQEAAATSKRERARESSDSEEESEAKDEVVKEAKKKSKSAEARRREQTATREVGESDSSRSEDEAAANAKARGSRPRKDEEEGEGSEEEEEEEESEEEQGERKGGKKQAKKKDKVRLPPEERRRLKLQKLQQSPAVAAARAYLEQWDSAREAWQFKKNRQTYLIGNADNPVFFDERLFAIYLRYVEGMQGGARKRALGEARANIGRYQRELRELETPAGWRDERAEEVLERGSKSEARYADLVIRLRRARATVRLLSQEPRAPAQPPRARAPASADD